MNTEQGKEPLSDAIYALARKYGKIRFSNGIVYITEPDGTIWSFTTVEIEEELTRQHQAAHSKG